MNTESEVIDSSLIVPADSFPYERLPELCVVPQHETAYPGWWYGQYRQPGGQ